MLNKEKKDMLGDIVRDLVTVPEKMLGTLADLIEKLLSGEGEMWLVALKRFLRKENPWPATVNKDLLDGKAEIIPNAIEGLIQPLGVATIPAQGQCVVDDSFRQGVNGISWVSDDFKKMFGGKVEEAIQEVSLDYGRLLRRSVDGPIIEALGGEAPAKTMLSSIKYLMSQQAKGQKGVLFTNGWVNIFYVQDTKDVLRAVDVSWSDDGWDVYGVSVGSPDEWSADYRVFSRKNSEALKA